MSNMPDKKEPAWMKWFHRSFMILLVIFGVLHLVSTTSKPLPPVVYSSETHTFSKQLVPFSAETFKEALQSSGKRQTLFFFYASWCHFCQEEFNMLRALRARFPEEALNIVYVSLDQDTLALSEFLRTHIPSLHFTYYHSTPETRDALFTTLNAEYALNPKGTVPYLVLFNDRGKLKAEHSGQASIPELKDMLSTVE